MASRVWFALSFPIVQISDYGVYYDGARDFAGLGPPSRDAAYSIFAKLFFAGTFRLFGDGLRVIGVANTVLYAFALTLLYAATCHLFDRGTATIAVAVCLCSLSELYFTNLASTEVPGMLFMTGILFIMSRGFDSWRQAFRLGALGGLAVYNRSNIFPMGALALAYEFMRTRRAGIALKKAALVQLTVIAVTLPLCVFNYGRFGRFTPMVANAETLWFGNNPRLSGDVHNYTLVPEERPLRSLERARLRREFAPFYSNPDPDLEGSKLGPYEISDLKVRYALGWIRRNPGRYLQLILARFQLFFFSCTYGEVPFRTAYSRTDPRQPRWTPAHERLIERARLPIRRLYQVLISGAALGLLVSCLHYGPRSFLSSARALPLVIVAYYTIPLLLIIAINRHHVPILCLCWVYLAHGLVILGRALRPRAGATPLHAPAA